MRKSDNTIILVISALTIFLSACNEILDKENLTGINPSDVYSNEALAGAYVNDLYARLMPGNPSGTGNNTDEGVVGGRATNAWLTGTATFDSYNIYNSSYANIRLINQFLDNIDDATFDPAIIDELKGQALFWRAWVYYNLVKSYGGVPLILISQVPTSDLEELSVERSKTSICVAQIIQDLDDAINLLPSSWTGEDVGRIDKGVGMAFKGRVLLFFASPLFDGLGGVASWQIAYEANRAAKDFLVEQGKGLYSPYKDIWDVELNMEHVMIRRFNFPQSYYSQAGVIPLTWSSGNAGQDKPSLELVNAFPMKDGSAWDPATMSLDTLWRYRDDRFYANIYYNGSPNQYVQGMRDDESFLWTYYEEIEDLNGPTGIIGTYNPVTDEVGNPSASSFHRIKAVDKHKNRNEVGQCDVDWPEIRFTEVLMNLGECANEMGNTTEALDILKQVRARAGILEGTGDYGIKANSKDGIRTAYINERFVEFCFEGKRWDDLRRHKMFGYLRDLRQRRGIALALKDGETHVAKMDDIDQVYTKFDLSVVETDVSDFAISDQFYIYGIPTSVLDRNTKLTQNNNWGGDFDPLQ